MGREALCGRLRGRFCEATRALSCPKSRCAYTTAPQVRMSTWRVQPRGRDGAFKTWTAVLVGVPRIERRMGEVTRRESGARGPTPSRENHQDPHESTSGTRRPRKKRPKPRGEEAPRPRVRRESESRRDCAHERQTRAGRARIWAGSEPASGTRPESRLSAGQERACPRAPLCPTGQQMRLSSECPWAAGGRGRGETPWIAGGQARRGERPAWPPVPREAPPPLFPRWRESPFAV